MNRLQARNIHPHWAIAASAMIFASCIAPHPVKPEIEVFGEVRFADDVLVTVGPRRLLANLSGKIESDPRGVVVIDGLRFRDTAFPEGGWRLKDLLGTAELRDRVISKLAVDYLVLIGPARIEEYGEEKGEMLFLVPGAVWGEETSSLNAAIIDLKTGRAASRLAVTASGTYRVATYLLYMVGTDPMTESAVLQGLADSLVDWLTEHGQGEGVRIALLAAESAAEPFHSPASDEIPTVRTEEQNSNLLRTVALFEDLEKRGDMYFEKESAEPFTGVRTTYFPDGRPAASIEFKDGLLDGVYSIWDADGTKRRETRYESGAVIDDQVWCRDGTPTQGPLLKCR